MKRIYFVIIIILLSCLTNRVNAQEAELSSKLKTELLDSISQAIDRQAYVYGVDFTRWKTVAADQQTIFEKAATDEEFAQKVNAAFNRFGVSHLNLRTPKTATERQAGKNTGAGIYWVSGKSGYDIYNVRRGSPAETAGLQAGDVIVSVDGR
jgi:C-terminal processing protease CtpA/Prc